MKKLKFDIFSDTLSVGVRKGSKALYQKVVKQIGGEEGVAAKLMVDGIKRGDAVTVRSMTDEIFWKVNGSNIIFPDSTALFKALCNSKIELKGDPEDALAFPFNSFIVATPKESGIRSRLVTLGTLKEKGEAVNNYLGDWIPSKVEFQNEKGQAINKELCICDQLDLSLVIPDD